MLTGRKARGQFQDVRIREIPVPFALRFRAALEADAITLPEWFIVAAGRTVDAYEKRVAKRRAS